MAPGGAMAARITGHGPFATGVTAEALRAKID